MEGHGEVPVEMRLDEIGEHPVKLEFGQDGIAAVAQLDVQGILLPGHVGTVEKAVDDGKLPFEHLHHLRIGLR